MKPRIPAILAGLLLCVPAIGAADTLEHLLYEKGLISQAEYAGAEGAGANIYWKEGSRLEFPDEGFTVKINTQIQSRYVFTDKDEAPNTSSFEMRRVRLALSGTVLNKEFEYKIQQEFKGTPELLDAFLVWRACPTSALKMGQFKSGISRQFNTSSYMLQFPDRSVASEQFDLDRQAGAELSYTLMDGKLLAAAQMFNGESAGEGRNKVGVDTNHTGVVTLRADVLGKMNAFEEGDIAYSDEHAINVGAAYAYGEGTGEAPEGGFGSDFEKHSLSTDVNWKHQGASLHTEFFWRSLEDDAGAESDPVGFYAQGGYFLKPKKLEVAARYSYVDCDDGTADGTCRGADENQEVTASLNYYFWEHALKAQLAYSLLSKGDAAEDGGDLNDNRWLFQLSSNF